MIQNLFLQNLMLFALTTALLPIAGCNSETKSDPRSGSASSAVSMDEVRSFLRSMGLDPDLLLNDPSLNSVTREMGSSVISMAHLPFRSSVAAAPLKPWSSWWFPKRDDFLVNSQNGQLSALEKYDLVRAKLAADAHLPAPPSAAADERAAYDPNSLSWEGLCDAWSLASIDHAEPRNPVTMQTTIGPVVFSVGDLKGLLLKTYEGVEDRDLTYYGQKFVGNEKGWIYPDIYPNQFHRFIEKQLFEQHEPFVMDHDPGIQVWNVPVYKANYLVEAVPGRPDAVQVRMWLYSAESVLTNQKDFTGTVEGVREYDYVLEGTRHSQGDLVVTDGTWIVGPSQLDSRNDHPDYFTRFQDLSRKRKSWNPQVDPALVDQILQASY